MKHLGALRPWVSAGLGGLVALVLHMGAPAPAAGQALGADLGTDCELERFREIEAREAVPGSGRRITRVSRPLLVCPNNVRIQADSAVIYEETGRSEMIGSVRFRSPERELDADLADWYEGDSRLFARGNVRFRDTERDTEIRGDTLNYLEQRPGRPEDELTVWGSRPTASLVPSTEPGARPFQVTANRLRLQGERFFWGDGEAELERDDLTARADSLVWDQSQEQLVLNQDAFLEQEGTEAEGDRINLILRQEVVESLRIRGSGQLRREGVLTLGQEIDVDFQEEQVTSLAARGEARLQTDEYDLAGDDIQVELDEEQEVRSVRSEGSGDAPATLETEEIFMRGLLILVPEPGDPEVRILRAEGEAWAESSAGDAPPIRVSEDWTIERDWIRGDEIEATFEPAGQASAPSGEDDDAVDPADPEARMSPEEGEDNGPQWQLRQLVATGQAATLYRQPPDDDGPSEEEEPADDVPPSDPQDPDVERPTPDRPAWAVSYVKADRIEIRFSGGEVEELVAEGNVDGIQSEPVRSGSGSPEEDQP
ncbi:MAG: hypothetical protein EA352_03975 [Gemmatimonadales bacterium]|nr:MAG: hypothetical protein EA352_03975 [Gemmatimonadales bacterium]